MGKYFSTTPIRRRERRVSEFACAKGWRARKIATVGFHWVSVFIGGGRGILASNLLPPLEPFWQRASWVRYTMTKGMEGVGGGRKEKEKKKGKNARDERSTEGSTDRNKRSEARGRGTRCEVNTGCPVNFIPKDWPRDALRFMECILVKIHSEMKGVLHITWKIARFLVKRMNSIVTWTTPPPPPPLPPLFFTALKILPVSAGITGKG